MHTPKLTPKRVLGLGLAAALAVASTVTFAGSSEAVAASYSLNYKTGPGAVAGKVLQVTGKAFTNGVGTSLVGTVDFNSAATCPSAAAGTAATQKTVISATRINVTVPSLALGTGSSAKAYLMCVYTSAGGNALMGSAKYTVYPVPTVTSLTATSGPSLGGTTTNIVGTNFTKASKVTIGGTAATAVKFVDATTLQATVPAHAVAAAVQTKVTTEGGDSADVAGDNFGFVNAITVSPTVGNGTSGDVLTIQGTALDTYTWSGTFAASSSHIMLVRAGTTLANGTDLSGGAPAGSTLCNTIQVDSPTSLTCQLAANVADGAYSVVLLTVNGSSAIVAASSSSLSRSATYAVADF
jgi:hypothetical protein